MGINERKERERAKMHRLIIDTASALFMKGGLDNISIRKIAENIEYSPATIYLYFKDKDEIIGSLRDRSINDFIQKLEEFSFITDQFGRIKNLSVSWVDFAITDPKKYQLIFMDNEDFSEDRIHKYISPLLYGSISENRIQRMPLKEASVIFISFLHGLSFMLIHRDFEMTSKAEMKEFAETVINRFLNSLRGGY